MRQSICTVIMYLMLKSVITYALAFSSSCFFAWLCERRKTKKLTKCFLFLLVVFPPIFISGFRVGVGIDYDSYVEMFYQIKAEVNLSNILSFYVEPLWTLINLVAPSSRFVFIISSALYSILVTCAIWRMRDKIGFCFPLFISYMVFYSLSYNGTRQAIACAIILLGLSFCQEKKITYFICVIIAALFHKSALFMFFVPLLKGKRSRLVIVYIVVILISLMVSPIVNVIKDIISVFGIYSGYLDVHPNASYGFLLYTLPVVILLQMLIAKYNIRDPEIIILLTIYILQIPLQLIGNHIAYADRVAEYCLISQIFLVPYVCRQLPKKAGGKACFVFCLWYVAHYVAMFIVLNAGGVYPYCFGVV